MKSNLLLIFIVSFVLCKSQNDTLLINEFSLLAYDDTVLVAGDTAFLFNLKESNKGNVEYQNWQNYSEMAALANDVTNVTDGYMWFDNQLWRKWHIIPYTESIDTLFTNDSVSYDTTSNFGIRSFSWLEGSGYATSVLMTSAVFIKDNTAKLYWKSMPVQGPRHQDGYKVYVLNGGLNDPEYTPFGTMSYEFAMKELDVSNSSPIPTLNSLTQLENDFGFIPSDGVNHTRYTLPDSNELGEVDSTRQQPFMQEFELDLSLYSGFIQIAFVHDSYDNNGIILDDILIKGTGSVGQIEVEKFELNVYPNPVSNELFIENNKAFINAFVEVFDLNGRLVLSDKLKPYLGIDLSELDAGQYIVKLQSNVTVYTQTFIKIK